VQVKSNTKKLAYFIAKTQHIFAFLEQRNKKSLCIFAFEIKIFVKRTV